MSFRFNVLKAQKILIDDDEAGSQSEDEKSDNCEEQSDSDEERLASCLYKSFNQNFNDSKGSNEVSSSMPIYQR